MIASQYVHILLYLIVVFVLAIVLVIAAKTLALSRPNSRKNSPYECGFEPFEEDRVKFDVRYYLIAILFILFDLEAAFLIPWAIVFKTLKLYGFFVMLIFLLILIVGFIYIWKRGALEWE